MVTRAQEAAAAAAAAPQQDGADDRAPYALRDDRVRGAVHNITRIIELARNASTNQEMDTVFGQVASIIMDTRAVGLTNTALGTKGRDGLKQLISAASDMAKRVVQVTKSRTEATTADHMDDLRYNCTCCGDRPRDKLETSCCRAVYCPGCFGKTAVVMAVNNREIDIEDVGLLLSDSLQRQLTIPVCSCRARNTRFYYAGDIHGLAEARARMWEATWNALCDFEE